jgi:hypothetical protein
MHKDVYGAPNTIFSPLSKGLLQYMQQWLVTPVVDRWWMLGKYFGKKAQANLFQSPHQMTNLLQSLLYQEEWGKSSYPNQWDEDHSIQWDKIDWWENLSTPAVGANTVITVLQKNPVWLAIHVLASETGLDIHEIMSEIGMLEVMWQIVNDGGVWRLK